MEIEFLGKVRKVHNFCFICNSFFHFSLELLTDFAKKRLKVGKYFLVKIGCFNKKSLRLGWGSY